MNPSTNSVPTAVNAITSTPHAKEIVSTLTRIEPATMFKDGLHLIFAFLNQRDWNSCIRTCHHWSTAAESEPTRNYQLTIPIDGEIEIVGSGPFQSGSYRLHHHITSTIPTFAIGTISRTNVEELDNILNLLPSLTHIHALLEPHPSTMYLPHLNWPISITHLSFYLNEIDYPDIIRSLSKITHLKKLELRNPSYSSDWSSYQSLASLTELETLTMTGWKEIDLITLIGEHFPLSLTTLYLGRTSIHSLNRLHLPQLVEFNLASTSLGPCDLRLIHRAMPKLRKLNPNAFHVEEFDSLALFQQLETVVFYQEPTTSLLAEVSNDAETMAVNGLINCPSLTAMEFDGSFTFRTADHWSALALFLPRLTSLAFMEMSDHIEALLPMSKQLKILRLEGLRRTVTPRDDDDDDDHQLEDGPNLTEVERLQLPTLAKFIELERLDVFQELDQRTLLDPVVDTIRTYFDNPLILPKLRYLNVRLSDYHLDTCLYDLDDKGHIGVGTYRLPRPNSTSIE